MGVVLLVPIVVLGAAGAVGYYVGKSARNRGNYNQGSYWTAIESRQMTDALFFDWERNTNYHNDPALPLAFGPDIPGQYVNERETNLDECWRACHKNPKCLGFGVERRPDLTRAGKVKCWFKNTKNPLFKETKRDSDYFVKKT